ncbi:MAG: hypothetical protein Q9186_002944 [Xanthomendoza sp. 1 TL-2023]
MKSRRRAPTTKEEASPNYFNYLPPELVLEVMRWTNPQALNNLIDTKNKRITAIAAINWKTILVGISAQQFSEYHHLFGVIGKETPDQEYNVGIEEESGEWWKRKDDEELQKALESAYQTGIEGAAPPPTVFCPSYAVGRFGRIELFITLAKDIERAATALDEVIEFDAGSKNLTKKALMLFWNMQWQDRPGLDRLCNRDDTDRFYLSVRYSLFAAEAPEVQARFRDIFRALASRLWNDLEFWNYTAAWSTKYKRRIRRQRQISIRELEIWLQDLIAELTLEVISRIGILRAIELDHADYCSWRTGWINEEMGDRLMDILRGLPGWLHDGRLPRVFEFGRKIGLVPEEIVKRGIPMLSELIYVGMRR